VSRPPSDPSGSSSGGGGLSSSAPGGYSVGDAFNYGWSKFQANVGTIVLGALLYIGVGALIAVAWFFITAAIANVGGESDAGAVALLVNLALFGLVGFVVAIIVQAGIARAALAITYGEPIEVRTLLSFDNLPQIILGAVLIGVATAIGSLLCVIPALVVGFFSQFFVFFAIDKQLSAVDAIRGSVRMVNANIATVVTLFIASLIATAVGGLVCLIGSLVAYPVVVIAQAYTYRRLQGEPVAA
jgi:uncharacterized membrane protein